MKRVALLLSLGVLAGCPPLAPQPAHGGAGGPQAVEPEVGCPSGSDVYIASYLSADPGKGHTGWVLPIRDDKAESVTGVPEFEELAPGATPDLVLPKLPVWIMEAGVPPCRARIGKPYRAGIDVPGSPNISYGVELDGCRAPAEQDEDEAVVVGSMASPGQCQIVTPHPVAARLGDIDPQKKWSRPTKQVGVPVGIAPLIPQKACAAPDCEMLWSFLQVDVDNAPVAWSGAVNWMQTPAAPADVSAVCKYPVESWSGFFVPGPNKSAVKITDGQDHPLALTAVLADKAGAHVLLADGAGEYSTYDITPTGVTLAHHLVWLLADASAYGVDDRVGPVCEQPPQGPPPAPGAAPAAPRSDPPLQPMKTPAHPG